MGYWITIIFDLNPTRYSIHGQQTFPGLVFPKVDSLDDSEHGVEVLSDSQMLGISALSHTTMRIGGRRYESEKSNRFPGVRRRKFGFLGFKEATHGCSI